MQMMSIFAPFLQSTVLIFSTCYRLFVYFHFFPPNYLDFFDEKEGPTHVRTFELLPNVCISSWKAEEPNENKPASNEEGQIPT